LNIVTRAVYNDGFEVRIGFGGELPMDGKSIEFSKASSVTGGPFEIRSLPARRFQTAEGRGHEVLVAEGHYRCPHCHPAGSSEKNAPATRMR
jgi:hypothetical protein